MWFCLRFKLCVSFSNSAAFYYTHKRKIHQIAIERSMRKTSESYSCRYCDEPFDSRNALFRHLRQDPNCSKVSGIKQAEVFVRETWALQLSYFSQKLDSINIPEAEFAGTLVLESLNDILDGTNVNFVGSTQASLARQRHKSLSQEIGAAACGDVLVFSVDVPSNVEMRKLVQKVGPTIETETLVVKINDTTQLPKPLHAEQACTQQVYHYLLPFAWLPHGKELEEWILQDLKLQAAVENSQHTNKFVTKPPNDSLRRFRDALRSAESIELSSKTSETDASSTLNTKPSTWRYGTFGYRRRRSWHNFADPDLMGEASPNQEPVWRSLDKSRLVRYHAHTREDGREEAYAVVEFRGDGFVRQQVRRITATALAMSHGLLPSHTIDNATLPSLSTWTPLAPAGRLYLADVRFHFDEQRNRGKRLLPSVNERWVQEKLLQSLEPNENREREIEWLESLRNAEHKMTLDDSDLKSEASSASENNAVQLESAPDMYIKTLNLLREIVEDGSWPKTSKARSSVIAPMSEEGDTSSGSFTVVNPNYLRHGVPDHPNFPLPKANELFPDLVQAVFELESALASSKLRCALGDGSVASREEEYRRGGSSHCAVNCNAQFTPHVDSGRGAGQSLSMIVGLGDYERGHLAVEGTYHSIRYSPLEFDGWKLRHWTQGYNGERFSLVWFTPEC